MADKFSFKRRFLDENTLLVSFLGVYPAIVFATSAVNGALLGASVLLLSAAVFMFASLTRRYLKNQLSAVMCGVFSALLSAVAIFVVGKLGASAPEGFGAVLPFAGINGAVVCSAYKYGRVPAKEAFSASLANGYGYGFAVLLFGCIRELLASGALFGFKFFEPLGFFSTTYGALLILACLAATFAAVMNKANEYEDDENGEGEKE